jgi:hypothetical protein
VAIDHRGWQLLIEGYTVGWVNIGTSTGVQSGFVYFHEKIRKKAKKVFWSSDLFRKGHLFLCQALYNGPNFFSQYGVDGYQMTQNLT